MQLNLTTALGLLAAITPVLATSSLDSSLKDLIKANKGVFEELDEMQRAYESLQTAGPAAVRKYIDDIINPKNRLIRQFPASVDESDQADVCESFVTFADTAQDLLNLLIEHRDYFWRTPHHQMYFDHMLEPDQELTKTLSYDISGVTPSCGDKLADTKQRLENTYKIALEKYAYVQDDDE